MHFFGLAGDYFGHLVKHEAYGSLKARDGQAAA